MQRVISLIGIALLAIGCSTQTLTNENEQWKPTYRVQLGSNKGGVVENTDFSSIPNTPVDAYSGATCTGFNASGKIIIPFKRNALETGVDFMHNSQTFTYADHENGYDGQRKMGVTQIMVPITYSIGVFKKHHPEGLFQVKVGYAAQFNLFAISNGTGNLPEYSTNVFSNGATLGFSTTPFRMKNGAKLGFYVDGYRGSQAYEDFYNRTEFEMPGTAFIKYGIIYQF